jgi:hypothetical protein
MSFVLTGTKHGNGKHTVDIIPASEFPVGLMVSYFTSDIKSKILSDKSFSGGGHVNPLMS